jgi:hypothetical protein
MAGLRTSAAFRGVFAILGFYRATLKPPWL